MNKKMLSMITALTVAGTLGTAAARTQTASMGLHNSPTNNDNFFYNTQNGSVLGVSILPAGSLAAWQLGLVIDTFGMKTATVGSRTGGALGTPMWRLVCANAAGVLTSMSEFATIPVSSVFVPATRTAMAPPNGTCFIQAFLNTGARILGVSFNE